MINFGLFNSFKGNKLLFRMVPNIITISRIIMTIFMICLLVSWQYNMFIFIGVNALIFISDLIDGRIARYFSSATRSGEILDVSADLLYIVSMSTVMIVKKIIPFYYLVSVLCEFYIFIVTSQYIKKDKKYLGFDVLGRMLAALYYIIPAVMFVAFRESYSIYSLLYIYGFYVIYVLTFIVIIYRISLCLEKVKCASIKKIKYFRRNNNENRNCIQE